MSIGLNTLNTLDASTFDINASADGSTDGKTYAEHWESEFQDMGMHENLVDAMGTFFDSEHASLDNIKTVFEMLDVNENQVIEDTDFTNVEVGTPEYTNLIFSLRAMAVHGELPNAEGNFLSKRTQGFLNGTVTPTYQDSQNQLQIMGGTFSPLNFMTFHNR